MKPKFTPQAKVKRNPGLITSNIDGEVVMMSVDNGEYYGLDEIGSRIWELLENPITIDQLVSKLIDEFDVDKVNCTNDTIDFLHDLLNKNLLLVEE